MTLGTVQEPQRQLSVSGSYDVVVAGGGPAGVGACLAAARAGARTLLLEAGGCLGGTWTAGLVCWVIDGGNKPGIMAEITAALEQRGVRQPRLEGQSNYAFDVEAMKLLLEELCQDAQVDVQLHTRVAAAAVQDGRLKHVITESSSGRQAWQTQVGVDATGNGDLAALAGCGFELGHPDTGVAQPMSLAALVGGIRYAAVEPFTGGGAREPKERLLAEIQRSGLQPSYALPVLLRIRDDLFAFIANHEYGVDGADARAVTAATFRARAEVHRLVHGLRRLGGVWEDLRLIATAEQIGVREGRRVRGRDRVVLEDLVRGRTREDGICRVTAGLDVHSLDPERSRATDSRVGGRRLQTRPYDIPRGALIARDVDGLLLAGRCISGDFFAHSSYRMTGNAVAMGEAAGALAACAARGA